MNNNLEEKRREIFELHQSWLRPDTALMRKPAPAQQAPVQTEDTAQKENSTQKLTVFNKNWIVKIAVVLAISFVVLELIFFAYELGWFK